MTIPAPWPCRNHRFHPTLLLVACSAASLLTGPIDAAANATPDTARPTQDVCDDYVPARVIIDAGEISNSTVVDLGADGGTAIGDSSGGDENLAVEGSNDHDNDRDKRDNDRQKRREKDQDSDDIASAGNGGAITSSAGNGGVSTASADGGAVSIGDVNSGGNAGNAIAVGDTFANPITVPSAPDILPSPRPGPNKPVPVVVPDAPRPGKVVIVTRLPSTGVAQAQSDLTASASLLALLTGLASLAARRRYS